MHHKLFKEEGIQDVMTCSIRSSEAQSYPSRARSVTSLVLSALFLFSILIIPAVHADDSSSVQTETSLTPEAVETSFASTEDSMRPHPTPIGTKPRPIPQSQPSVQSGGSGRQCKTIYAWNGQVWVKRNIMSRTGRIIKGSHCHAVNPLNLKKSAFKPTKPGIKGISDDLTPLPYNWYKESSQK